MFRKKIKIETDQPKAAQLVQDPYKPDWRFVFDKDGTIVGRTDFNKLVCLLNIASEDIILYRTKNNKLIIFNCFTLKYILPNENHLERFKVLLNGDDKIPEF